MIIIMKRKRIIVRKKVSKIRKIGKMLVRHMLKQIIVIREKETHIKNAKQMKVLAAVLTVRNTKMHKRKEMSRERAIIN